MKWLIFLLVLSNPVAAFAQSNVTGSIITTDAATLSEEGRFVGDAARAFGDKFATCVVNRHYIKTVKALALAPDSAEQFTALHKVFDSKCILSGGMNVEMQSNPVSFRNSLYKALVRKSFARTPFILAAAPISTTGRNAGMIAFADCVVRLDSQASLRLILAVAGTSKERAAIDGLRPQLGQCLTPGKTVSLARSSFSAAISEAYYREAKASQPVGSK